MTFNATEQFEQALGKQYQKEQEQQQWPDLRDLPGSEAKPLRLDANDIPGGITDFCQDIAHRMQCPLDFVVGAVLTIISTVAGDLFVVQPRRFDTSFRIKLTLWCLLIGDPTVRKSPATSAVMKFLIELDALIQESNEFYAAEYESSMQAYEINKARATQEAKNTKGEKQTDGTFKQIDDQVVRKYFNELNKPEKPRQEILYINECTPQKLVELWQTNPNGFLISRDEIVALFKEMEAAGQEGTRGLLMEAHDGQIPRRKGTKHDGVQTARPLSSLIGTIQPDVLRNYIRKNLKGNSGNDGFLPRFGLMLFPDPVEDYQFVDQAPNSVAADAFRLLLARLNGLVRPFNELGHRIYTDEDRQPIVLKLDDQAYECYEEWEKELHGQEHLKNPDLPNTVKTHLGKYGKLVPTLAGLFHLIEIFSNQTSEDVPTLISVDNFARACDWAEYLEQHAKRAYGLSEKISSADEFAHSRHLLDKITSGKLKDNINDKGLINARVIANKRWGELGKTEVLMQALEQLEEYGWVKVTNEKNKGNKISNFVEINPNVQMAE